jgi:hypothetical protein
MPPSTDDLPGKTPPEHGTRQGGMKRKPGKQPGAPGAHLATELAHLLEVSDVDAAEYEPR